MFGIFGHIGDEDNLIIRVKKQLTQTQQSYNLNLANWKFNGLEPDPLRDLGIEAYHPPIPNIIGTVAKNSPAAKAGLQKGDKVLRVNGNAIFDWEDFIKIIRDNPQKTLHLEIQRDHTLLNVSAMTDWKFGPGWKKIGFLGIISQKIEWPQNMLLKERLFYFYSFTAGMARYI